MDEARQRPLWVTDFDGRVGYRWNQPLPLPDRLHPTEWVLATWLLDRGGPRLDLDYRDNRILRNGEIIGLALDGLTVEVALSLIQLHGPVIRYLQWHLATSFDPRIVAALASRTEPLTLSLQEYRGDRSALQALRPLLHRLVGLLFFRTHYWSKSVTSDDLLKVLDGAPRLRFLHLLNGIGNDGIPHLATLPALEALVVPVDHEPLSAGSQAALARVPALRHLGMGSANTDTTGQTLWLSVLGDKTSLCSIRLFPWMTKRGTDAEAVELFGRFPELRAVSIDRSYPAHPGELRKLTTLSVRASEAGQFSVWLSRSDRMRLLDLTLGQDDPILRGAALAPGDPIARAKRLEWLRIDAQRAIGKSIALPRLEHLQVLQLLGSPVKLPFLAQLEFQPRLAQLEVHEAGALTTPMCAAVGRIRTLRSLLLAKTGPDIDACVLRMTDLARLESLSFDTGQLGERGFASLSKLAALRDLSLPGTSPSPGALERLAPLKRLSSLVLAETSDEAAAALSPHQGLRSLEVVGRRLTARGTAAIARLASLRKLVLSHAEIGPGWLRPLARLEQLRELRLETCRFLPHALGELAGARSLRLVTLGNSVNGRLTEAAMAYLRTYLPGVVVIED